MMRATLSTVAGCLTLLILIAPAAAEETVRYYEENGVTYREVRRVEPRPVSNVEWQSRERTVYRDRIVTEMRDSQRVVYTPVTEYAMEPRWHNWWNPFGRPYVAYHMKPVTRWETRIETVQRPHTYRETIPEREIVQVPKRTLQFQDHEVVERVALEPVLSGRQLTARPVTPGLRTAERVGGVGRLENDPPRQPTNRY